MFDVIISGGGIVGLALAHALKNTTLKVALLEAKKYSSFHLTKDFDLRVYALHLASVQLLRSLEVWQHCESCRVQPYDKMHVWSQEGDGAIDFAVEDMLYPQLGFIVEHTVLMQSLLKTIADAPNIEIFQECVLSQIAFRDQAVEVVTNGSRRFQGKLLVGADGARSFVREAANISIENVYYGHDALITVANTEKPHNHTAWQIFLPTGPLAFLPLPDSHQSAIVWSGPPEKMAHLQECDHIQFCEQLTVAFENRLGRVTGVKARHQIPLRRQHASAYVQSRVALVGDSAHTIHPMAGQGLNMGLMGAANLAARLRSLAAEGEDVGELVFLKPYERERRYHNQMMLLGLDALHELFKKKPPLIGWIRDLGLHFTHQFMPLKKQFMKVAMGTNDVLPERFR